MDHKKEMQLISDLMEQLIDEMDYSSDDLEERLGRRKPEVESIEVGVIEPADEDLEEEEEELEDDDEDFARRLARLRG